MKPSDDPPGKGSETDSRKSAEGDSQQGNSEPVTSDVPEATESGPVDSASFLSFEREEKNDSLLDEQQKILLGQEIQNEEKANGEGKESSKEDTNFFKCMEEFASAIKKFSSVMAYSSKNRPKQPHLGQPAIPPREPPGPGSNRPAMVPRRPEPPQRPPPQPTSQQQPPQRAPRAQNVRPSVARVPDSTVPIYVNGAPLYSLGYPLYAPATIYGSFLRAHIPDNVPASVPRCLAQLYFMDTLYVIKYEVFGFFDVLDYYFIIQNKNGECVYIVYETIEFRNTGCCGGCQARSFHVVDVSHNEAFLMHRLAGCSDACCSCCCSFPEIEVCAPPDIPVGVIAKKFNFFRDEYTIEDPGRNLIFKVIGSSWNVCTACCWSLMETGFTIRALDEDQTIVGYIKKHITYYSAFYDSDLYALTFPSDLDVRMKAVFEFNYYAKTDGFSFGLLNNTSKSRCCCQLAFI